MSEGVPPVPLLRHQREAVITRLCEEFAQDRLEADELERLIDIAHRATTVAELEALVPSLPAVARSAVELPAPPRVEGRQTVVAIMGGSERRGAWVTSSTVQVVALMGGAVLDFRETRLPLGVTEVEAVAIMGGIEIIVPPGVRVVSEGWGILGGFEQAGDTLLPAGDVPTLRVTGVALMGGVEIKERMPGETGRDARRRRKRERLERDQHQIRRLRER
jgi:hypothetical protein